MDVRPVGAITTRDYRFKSRPWDNPTVVDTICTQCSKGCNTTAWIKAKPEWAKGTQIIRYTPRFNPDVNGYWMCDTGRFDYHWVEGTSRLRRPLARDERGFNAVSWPEVVSVLRMRLEGEPSRRVVRFLLSAHASHEQPPLLDAWYFPLAVGQPLPTIPLWLSPTLHITLRWNQATRRCTACCGSRRGGSLSRHLEPCPPLGRLIQFPPSVVEFDGPAVQVGDDRSVTGKCRPGHRVGGQQPFLSRLVVPGRRQGTPPRTAPGRQWNCSISTVAVNHLARTSRKRPFPSFFVRPARIKAWARW